jgi:predicted secreted acid phosphatase
MGNRSNRRKKPSRLQRISQNLAVKTINYDEKEYTLFVYRSEKHKGKFSSVLTDDNGVVYQGDNFPSIGDAINQTKEEYLGI